MRDVVDDFGFVGDSSTNNDAAFASLQTAIDTGLSGTIYFPFNRSTAGTAVSTGAYKTTSNNPLVIKNDDTRLVFEPGARINWQPTGAGTCIKFEHPSGTLLRCGVQDIRIQCPNNTGFQRIGIDVHDVRYSRFTGITTAGFEGALSTGLKVRGRDRLLFQDLNLQAERPLWMALNDREPTSSGKDLDHSLFEACNLIVVAPPNPAVYFDPGYVLRNVGFVEFAFAGGPIYWVDGATIPRRESINFYVFSGRFEQFADSGPVTAATYAVVIKKNEGFKLADASFDHLMLAPAAGNDWSGFDLENVERVSLRHCVYRGGGVDIAKNEATSVSRLESFMSGDPAPTQHVDISHRS